MAHLGKRLEDSAAEEGGCWAEVWTVRLRVRIKLNIRGNEKDGILAIVVCDDDRVEKRPSQQEARDES